MVQLISNSVSWFNLLHSLFSCKYTYTFISCPAGIPVCLRTTEHQGSTALAALSSRRPNDYTTGVALPIFDSTQDPVPRNQDPNSRHTPHHLIPGRLPICPTHETSPLQHPTPRDPKHHTRSPNPPISYLFAHLRHSESTISTAPPILTLCDKSQSLFGPKLLFRTRSQDARIPRGVLGLVRRCAVRRLQQVVRINLPSEVALQE